MRVQVPSVTSAGCGVTDGSSGFMRGCAGKNPAGQPNNLGE